MAYLQALGIDSYVSRAQLPGAGPSRRLAIVPRAPGAAGEPPPASVPASSAPQALPDLEPAPRPQPVVAPPHPVSSPAVRFNLAATLAGPWLWLEDLGGQPMAAEQAALVGAMAGALLLRAGDSRHPLPLKPQVALFDWPLHNNRQLDNGQEAARAGLAAFVGRLLQDSACSGLVVLGEGAAHWLDAAQHAVRVVQAPATRDMLSRPGLKRRAWDELQALL